MRGEGYGDGRGGCVGLGGGRVLVGDECVRVVSHGLKLDNRLRTR